MMHAVAYHADMNFTIDSGNWVLKQVMTNSSKPVTVHGVMVWQDFLPGPTRQTVLILIIGNVS